MRVTCRLFSLSLLIFVFSTLSASATSIGENSFTVFTQHAGDKIVYVSHTDGNDANNGLSSVANPSGAGGVGPKKTLAQAIALLTNNSSDFLLLRQNDTWINEVFGNLVVNGRSANEPIVIGSYDPSTPSLVDPPSGKSRPLLQTTAATGTVLGTNTASNNAFGHYIAVVGLEFYCNDRDPNNGAFNATARDLLPVAIFWGNGSQWSLFEDNKSSFYGLFINTTPNSLPYKHEQLILRRNIIVDHYGGVTVQLTGFERVTLYQNVWDKNGYNNQIGGNYLQGFGSANFSHGLYMADNLGNPSDGFYIDGPVDVIENTYARDVTSWHARTGGHHNNNLVLANTSNGDFGRPRLGTNNLIANNVFAENIDQPLNPVAITSISNGSPGFITLPLSLTGTEALTSVTPGTPAVFNLVGHGLSANIPIEFTTTGVMPTGAQANKVYWIISAGLTANAFEISTTRGGSALAVSDAGTGTLSVSQTFPAPNYPIYLDTTVALPAPLSTHTTYFVAIAGYNENGFGVSATNGGAAINTTTNGSGSHTMYDVGQSTDGQSINLYHLNPNIPGIFSSTGPVLVTNNIWTHYAGTVAYNAICLSAEAGQLSANYTVTSNISYKWAAKTAGQPLNLFIDNDGKGAFAGNIQDTNGTGTDDNTGLPITQYTTTSANSATMANYAASVGLTASLDGFMTPLRSRLPGTWDNRLGAGAVNDWYRAKFNLSRYVPKVGRPNVNFLLKRDVDPAANDNAPMWINVAA